jgi:hypothetical protein
VVDNKDKAAVRREPRGMGLARFSAPFPGTAGDLWLLQCKNADPFGSVTASRCREGTRERGTTMTETMAPAVHKPGFGLDHQAAGSSRVC